MPKKNIKYHILQSSDREETHHNEPETDGDCAHQFKIHWIVKLLFCLFVCSQLIYVIYSYDIEFTYFYGNVNNTHYRVCNTSSDINGECQDYDTLQSIQIVQLTTERTSAGVISPGDKQIITIDQLTTHSETSKIDVTTEQGLHPINGNDDDISNARNSSPASVDDDVVNILTTTPTSTTIDLSTDSASTHHEKGKTDVNDDGDYASTSSSSTQKQIDAIEHNSTIEKSHDHIQDSATTTTTTATSNTPNANYSNEKTNVVSAFEQWHITTEVLLHPTTLKTPTTTAAKPLVPLHLNSSKEQAASQQQRKYFINTSRCHIPFIDPFTSEARKKFKPSHNTGCSNNKDQAIVSSVFDESSREYRLRINYTVAMSFIDNSNAETVVGDLLCCYRQIERSGSGGNVDKQFKLLPCTNFHQDFVVPVHVNGVIVDCTSKSSKKLLQQDAFSFVHPVKQPTYVDKNMGNMSETENPYKGSRKMSLLLIGIDSLSRMNFRRNMPETFKYLVDKGWYEMKGYNKVGDNTLPNLMALLAGYTRTTTRDKCKPTEVGGLDNCNFIWTKFREYGFVTAYAEDTASISTFTYRMKGFKKPPTDHYFRPIALAIEKTMNTIKKAGLRYCVGRRQYGEYIYDYGLEFATRYKNHSNFGLFWTNSFSHNSYDTAATMDGKMLSYLQDIELRGIVENSVVLFFSDHGCRWGPLLKLPEGFLEERLPMFFISLPTWFKSEYPRLVSNLEVNQRRLATPFDTYMTLQHLLHMSVPAYNVTPAYDCPMAQSMFNEIPDNRTCTDACIPEAWCTCIPYMTQSTKSAVVKKITQLILNEMNKYLVDKNITSLCSELTLHEITRARLRDHDVDAMQSPSSSQSSNMETYVIEFTTNPKTKPATEFSATADYDAKRERIVLNVEDISRQSKYEDTAKCTNDKQAKKYCICKNSLKSS